jgi:hypothetical protein
MGTEGYPPDEAAHSLPSSAELKNCGALLPLPKCLHGVVFKSYNHVYGKIYTLLYTRWILLKYTNFHYVFNKTCLNY